MARRTVEIVVDDLDGERLEGADHEPVGVGLDGVDYRIDLSRQRGNQRAVLEPYLAAGARVARSGPAARSPGFGDIKETRAGAAASHHRLAQRGRSRRAHGRPVTPTGDHRPCAPRVRLTP